MFGAGHLPELFIIAIAVILLFGGSRIAGIGKGLGQGVRDFKSAVKKDEPEPGKPANS